MRYILPACTRRGREGGRGGERDRGVPGGFIRRGVALGTRVARVEQGENARSVQRVEGRYREEEQGTALTFPSPC